MKLATESAGFVEKKYILPANIPEQVLRTMVKPIIDHRGPEFKALVLEVLSGLKSVFKTAGPVTIFASSGTGAWEAGLVNTLSPGDKVLMFETGHFATLWKNMAVHNETSTGVTSRIAAIRNAIDRTGICAGKASCPDIVNP